MTQSVVTARIDADISARLDAIGKWTRRSRSWLTARALEEYVAREGQFLDFVNEGVAAVERGEVVEGTEADKRIDAMVAGFRGR